MSLRDKVEPIKVYDTKKYNHVDIFFPNVNGMVAKDRSDSNIISIPTIVYSEGQTYHDQVYRDNFFIFNPTSFPATEDFFAVDQAFFIFKQKEYVKSINLVIFPYVDVYSYTSGTVDLDSVDILIYRIGNNGLGSRELIKSLNVENPYLGTLTSVIMNIMPIYTEIFIDSIYNEGDIIQLDININRTETGTNSSYRGLLRFFTKDLTTIEQSICELSYMRINSLPAEDSIENMLRKSK